MTSSDFLTFYPQFENIIPDPVLAAFVESANARFDEFDEDTEEARRLYTAHKLTLYARTMPAALEAQGGASSFSALASAGDGTRFTSRKVDDVAVTYASGSSSSSAASGLEDLHETTFGIQLLSILRLHSYPRYVP